MAESENILLDDARKLHASQFANVMKHWLNLADAEGIRQRHDTLHEFRDVRIFEQFDGGFTLDGHFGPAQGALIKELFERFVAVERLADWEEARAEQGDQANVTHLRRTESQRRADAFVNALLQADAQPVDAVRPEPSVNIVMSSEAYEAGLAELAGTEPVRHDPRRRTKDTSAGNGAPLCGKHNRPKERGYRTWKDSEGHWHIQRPNGSTITPMA